MIELEISCGLQMAVQTSYISKVDLSAATPCSKTPDCLEHLTGKPAMWTAALFVKGCGCFPIVLFHLLAMGGICVKLVCAPSDVSNAAEVGVSACLPIPVL